MGHPVRLSGRSLQITAPAGTTTVGIPFLHGDFFGLPDDSITAADTDRLVNLHLDGVWPDLAKEATISPFAEGAPVYWDVTNAQCALSGRFIGHCATTGGVTATATTMHVRIDPRAHREGAASGTARLEFDPSANVLQRPIASYYGDSIPDNAVITRSWYEVITTCSSAGADAGTIALGLETVDVAGITAAVAISAGGNVWDAGFFDGIQDGTLAAFGVKTTADALRLQLDVAVQALLTGKLVLIAEWSVTA